MRWLYKEVRGKQLVFWVIACLCLQLAYILSAIEIIHLLFPRFQITEHNQIYLNWMGLLCLIGVALAEEMLFRLPLVLPIKLGWSINKILAIAALLSVVFGYLHGGIPYILLQGVWGFSLCLLFLKCGGLQKRYAEAFFVTLGAHLVYNVIMITINLIYPPA